MLVELSFRPVVALNGCWPATVSTSTWSFTAAQLVIRTPWVPEPNFHSTTSPTDALMSFGCQNSGHCQVLASMASSAAAPAFASIVCAEANNSCHVLWDRLRRLHSFDDLQNGIRPGQDFHPLPSVEGLICDQNHP